ncbi:MAG TPA: hypothetical protein VGZ51_10030 [Actinomycetota bacterium]|nr:hypothetical protein [Actinomycetota bacterium]
MGADGSDRADETASSLAREIYWAKEGDPRPPTDLDSIRDRLDEFAHRMRVEQRQLVPVGETLLGSSADWKRKAKLAIWRVTRFSTMRYDRLLAELAALTGELAQRLQETEEELARARDELQARGGGDAS